MCTESKKWGSSGVLEKNHSFSQCVRLDVLESALAQDLPENTSDNGFATVNDTFQLS